MKLPIFVANVTAQSLHKCSHFDLRGFPSTDNNVQDVRFTRILTVLSFGTSYKIMMVFDFYVIVGSVEK